MVDDTTAGIIVIVMGLWFVVFGRVNRWLYTELVSRFMPRSREQAEKFVDRVMPTQLGVFLGVIFVCIGIAIIVTARP